MHCSVHCLSFVLLPSPAVPPSSHPPWPFSYDDGVQNMTAKLRNGPTGAALTGLTLVPIVEGVADFLDLGITHRGSGMTLEFQSTYGGFTVTTPVDVLFSSEFQVGHQGIRYCTFKSPLPPPPLLSL